jgi:peptidoglycan hydrolase-like protein with peptidoglycan-binding domain
MPPTTDLAAPARWHESLSASRERRAAAWRRRRRRFRARSLLVAAAISMLVLSAGVALAASSGGTTSGRSATLSLGSTGAAVKDLQRKLRVSPTTGYYGTETKRAVKRYQASHGLTADGIAGPATLSRLGVRVRSSSYATGGAAPSSGTAPGGGSASSGGSNVKLPAALKRIAQCESGGNPQAVSRSGRYRGKYQFDQATWEAAGGTGDPAAAPESTQDRVALKLYRQRGTAPWPNCG